MSELMPTAFIRSPRWWVGHPKLSVDHLGMLSALMHFADYDTITCFPSQSTLANLCQRSRAWVNKILRELVDAGIVIKEQRYRKDRGMTSCLYRIVVENPNVPTPAADEERSKAAKENQILSVTTVTGGVKNHDTNKTQNNKNTLSNHDIASWKPKAETVARMTEVVSANRAEAYIGRFRAKVQQTGYQYPDFDAAVLEWFEEDRFKGRFEATSGPAKKPSHRSRWAPKASAPTPKPNTDLKSVMSGDDGVKGTNLAMEVLAAALNGSDARQVEASDQDRFSAAAALAIEIKGFDFYRAWLRDLELVSISHGRAEIGGGRAFQRTHLLQSSANERMLIDLCNRCGLKVSQIRSFA